MPFTRDDEEIFIHTVIRLRDTRNQLNKGYSISKIVTCIFLILIVLIIIDLVHVVTCKVGSHFLVYHIYTPEDPKKIGRTLGRG